MILDNKRVAFVVAHPAHLLLAAGMIIRLHPHILILTNTDTGAGAVQGGLIQQIMDDIGLGDLVTSLKIDETESYQQLLAGDYSKHLQWADQIYDWLMKVSPDAVLGDSYETSNIQHDIGSLMLHEAVSRCKLEGVKIEQYEIPLLTEEDTDDAPIQVGAFPIGSFEEYNLEATELLMKQQIAELARKTDPFVNHISQGVESLDTERFRPFPVDRDYQQPPPGLVLFYDQYGQMQVELGRYDTAITFDQHFLPLVRALRAKRVQS